MRFKTTSSKVVFVFMTVIIDISPEKSNQYTAPQRHFKANKPYTSSGIIICFTYIERTARRDPVGLRMLSKPDFYHASIAFLTRQLIFFTSGHCAEPGSYDDSGKPNSRNQQYTKYKRMAPLRPRQCNCPFDPIKLKDPKPVGVQQISSLGLLMGSTVANVSAQKELSLSF